MNKQRLTPIKVLYMTHPCRVGIPYYCRNRLGILPKTYVEMYYDEELDGIVIVPYKGDENGED